MFDVITIALLFLIANGFAWYWLFASKQDFSDRTTLKAFWITVRTIVVFGCVIGVAHVWFGVGLRVIWVAALVCAVVCAIGAPTSDVVGNGLFAFLAMPFFFAGQFVLGFPIRKTLVLTPEPRPVENAKNSYLNCRGVVASPLRPNGAIKIDGQSLDATSEDGTFVEIGTAVIVVDEVGATLVVQTASPLSEDVSRENV